MFNRKVFQNTKWIVGCKIAQSVLHLVVVMLSARYLGPANYGLISYAASVVAFAAPIMQLGMQSTLVQEYVSSPDKEGEIMGTSLVMNLVSGIACVIAVCGFVGASSQGDKVTVVVCALYSIGLIFQAVDMAQYWFQAKLLSKYSSLAALGARLVVSVYKIWLLATGESIYWFALSNSVEYCVLGIILIAVYKKRGAAKFTFSKTLAKKMFSKSKYYILASMMASIFQNTDHVMLKQIVGDAENGFYTTAVTCTNMASFVFTAIVDSARPSILESFQKSKALFEKSISSLYSVIIYLTFAQAVCFTLFAKPVVWILYGESFLPAVPALQICAWGVVFSYVGTIRNVWILANEKYNILWLINLSGAVANIILNAFMIPVWGASGAAFASVLTQFISNVVMGFIIKPIRPNNALLVKSLNPKILLEMIKDKKSA